MQCGNEVVEVCRAGAPVFSVTDAALTEIPLDEFFEIVNDLPKAVCCRTTDRVCFLKLSKKPGRDGLRCCFGRICSLRFAV